MEEIKPIKRSKELAPLSREHHDGLLFAWKVKQGLANNTPIETIVKYTQWFWNNHLKEHFSDEEKVFTKYLQPDDPLLLQMLKEHNEIRNLVTSLAREANAVSVESITQLINNHIRFEERQLFSYVEKILTQEQLTEIFNVLPQERHCETGLLAPGSNFETWRDEFWVKKK